MVFSLSAMIWFSIINKLKEIKFNSENLKKFSILYLSHLVCLKHQRNLLKQSYYKITHSKSIQKIGGTVSSFKSYSSFSCNSKFDSFRSIDASCGSHKNKNVNDTVWIPLAEEEEDFEVIERKTNNVLNMHLRKLHASNSLNGSNYEIKSVCNRKIKSSKTKNNKLFNRKNSFNERIDYLNDNQTKCLTEEQINSYVFDIINRTVFIIFLLFIVNLNFMLLIICPYFIKSSAVATVS